MKTQIRQGLFETSSSSEDSLSVSQDMNLYIVLTERYNLFKNGEGYFRFESNTPVFSEDEEYVYNYNLKFLSSKTGYEHITDQYKESKTFKHLSAYFIKDYLPYIYISYDEYIYMINHVYSGWDSFEYDNYDETIFGYYGYTYD
jgi:hypothetical protein